MPYPDPEDLARALLVLLWAEGGPEVQLRSSGTYTPLADYFGLTEQERTRGRHFPDARYEPEWNNKVQFARNELRKRGYLAESDRSIWRLSPAGAEAARAFTRRSLGAPPRLQPDLEGIAPERDRASSPASLPDVEELNITVREGGKKLITHFRRERDPKIVYAKRLQVLQQAGALRCEVCDFDFRHVYGDRGLEFCEVHHVRPFAEVEGEFDTTPDQLAILCSNCHRMIHRPPQVSVAELRREVLGRRS